MVNSVSRGSNFSHFSFLTYINEKYAFFFHEKVMKPTFDNGEESSSLPPRYQLILRTLSQESAPIQVLQELL